MADFKVRKDKRAEKERKPENRIGERTFGEANSDEFSVFCGDCQHIPERIFLFRGVSEKS